MCALVTGVQTCALPIWLERAKYQEVKTPQLVDRKLWEASGHWEKFRENMYIAENEEGIRDYAADDSQRIFALKPMNCPCHVQIFNQGLKSYQIGRASCRERVCQYV